MTRVYGTGIYDFQQHRVAKYPVAAEALPLSEKPAEAVPLSNVPSSISLSEIQRDRRTRIAAKNWAKTADSGPKKPFSSDLFLLIIGGRKPLPLQSVMILEVSQYSESYLWPNFSPETASFELVMSMNSWLMRRSHHEKLVIVDHKISFIEWPGLCFGRCETIEHRVGDFPLFYGLEKTTIIQGHCC